MTVDLKYRATSEDQIQYTLVKISHISSLNINPRRGSHIKVGALRLVFSPSGTESKNHTHPWNKSRQNRLFPVLYNFLMAIWSKRRIQREYSVENVYEFPIPLSYIKIRLRFVSGNEDWKRENEKILAKNEKKAKSW